MLQMLGGSQKGASQKGWVRGREMTVMLVRQVDIVYSQKYILNKVVHISLNYLEV